MRVPIDRDAGKRFLLGQHEIERGTNLSEFGGGEVGLPPHRREAGRHQQRVVLAQWRLQGAGGAAAQSRELWRAIGAWRRRGSRITMSRLGDARPSSRKLRCRCEML